MNAPADDAQVVLQPPYYYVAALTRCADTWLALPPDEAELQRIEVACRAVREHRKIAVEFHRNPQLVREFSLELFQRPDFAGLHLSNSLIEKIIAAVGEPPVVTDQDDPTFANYLRRAVLSIATSRVRRDLSGQLRRFLPAFVEREEWQAAVAIDHGAFRTALGNEVSPFLVQMTLQGLARFYDEQGG